MFSFVVLSAVIAAASAGVIPVSGPSAISYASYTPLVRPAVAVSAPAALTYSHAPIISHAPLVAHAVATKVVRAEPVDPNPAYSFEYGVNDPSTGDSKSQSEQLQNGVVSGKYTVNEPDGSVRSVSYTADDVNGFNAVVEKSHGKLVAAPVVAHTARIVSHAPLVSHAQVLTHAPAYTTIIH